MRVQAELLILPYASAAGRSLLAKLISEFREGEWTDFYGAVGFARTSGNFPALLEAMRDFASDSDRTISVTFGADVFGKNARGSDYEAIRTFLATFEDKPNVVVNLYHERQRTFHPKLYLFANRAEERALLIIGSSNWSEGGLVQNIEANVLLRLDLSDHEHRECFDELISYFEQYWSEADE